MSFEEIKQAALDMVKYNEMLKQGAKGLIEFVKTIPGISCNRLSDLLRHRKIVVGVQWEKMDKSGCILYSTCENDKSTLFGKYRNSKSSLSRP